MLALQEMGLPANAPLSVLAVEFYGPGGAVGFEYRELRSKWNHAAAEQIDEQHFIDEPFEAPDPFARTVFGRRRILRTSPLSAVQPVC